MRSNTGRKRPEASRTQAYVPFTEVDLKKLDDYCEREGHGKGWTIRAAVREYLERHKAPASVAPEQEAGA